MVNLINKYKPINLEDINLNNYTKKLLKVCLDNNNLNLLIYGKAGVGKTTLINLLLKLYYKSNDNINNNIIYLNLLKEQGINYYRNEIKNFCQINNLLNKYKKTIILDDINLLNEQIQLIISNYINNYKNINFIISCNDVSKIKTIITNKLELIEINDINNEFLTKLLNKILINEEIKLENEDLNKIINFSNNSISNMINIIEKIKIIYYDDLYNINVNENDKVINENNKILNENNKIIIKNIDNIICNIITKDFNKYIELCINNNIIEAKEYILEIFNNGYSVIDILDEFFIYIKNYSNLSDYYKYEIIKLICNYINIFNNVHEDNIELIFLTNNIINLFKDNII